MTTEPPPAPGILRSRDILLAALWFGLLAGLIEGVSMLVKKHVFDVNTTMGPHIIWLAPVMDVLWLAIPGLVLAILLYFWRAPRATRLAIFCLAFGAGLAVTFLATQMHTYALILLSIGIGVQVSAMVARRPAGFARLVRRTLPLLAGLTVLGAIVVVVQGRYAEKRIIGGLPQPGSGAPNVLLLILDTARSMSMSLDGFDRPTTPQLEEFARTGINFTRARSPSSWTLPSHASIFTGFFPHQTSTGFKTPLDTVHPTLAEALASHGYATAGFAANLHYVSREFGLQRGFAHYEDYAISPGELFLNSSLGRYFSVRPGFRKLIGYYDILGRKNAAQLNRSLLRWLGSRKTDRPFFAFVNYYDAHEPYLPPAEWDRKFGSATPRKPYQTDQSIRGARMVGKLRMTGAEIRREHEAYMSSLAYLDHEIGNLLDSMKQRGLLENTLVIITSDHGEQFGEKGYFVHGNSLYAPVLDVPLIVSYPGRVPANQVVDQRLNLRDLAATVLDLTGTAPARAFPGHSLRGLWDSTTARADEPLLFEVITSGKPIGEVEELRSVVWKDAEYIRHESGREELYDLVADPIEHVDLVKENRPDARLAELRAAMDSLLQATGEDTWGP